jgi:catecholate siderophore receptor
VRLNAIWQDAGVPGRDVVENKSWAVAPSLALGLGTATCATISYLHLEQDNIPDYGLPWVPATGTPTALSAYVNQAAPVEFSNFYGLKKRDYEKIDNDISTLQLEHDLNSSFTLRNTSRYGRTQRDSIITAPRFTGSAGSTDIRRTDWKSRDQIDDIVGNQTNLTGSFPTGPLTHDITAGLEISRETSKNFTRVATGPASPNTDLYHPNPDDPYTEVIQRNGAYTKATADSTAVYAFDTVKFAEKWQLDGGLHWDRFATDYTATASTPSKLSRSDDMLSWKAGAVFKPRENASIYAAYGTSFNPSAEGLALTTSTVSLEPEKTRNYEIGTKWDLERQLSVSAAIFRTKKTNARTPGVNAGDPPTVLQGEQRVDGVELGVSGNITPHWSAFAGYAFMKSTIEQSNTTTEVDNNLTLTPESTFNAWTNYSFPGGFSLGAGAQFMDSVFRNTTNTTSVPSYWLFNATAAYEVNKHLTLRLNVNNISDEKYVDRVGGGHFIPGAARSAVLTASLKF